MAGSDEGSLRGGGMSRPITGLPSGAAVAQMFGLYSPATAGCDVVISPDGAVACACLACARWHAFCAGSLATPGLGPARVSYQVLTSDLVAGLAAYFADASARAGLEASTLLELGAGDGALAAALGAHLAGAGVRVVATDRGDRGLHASGRHPVTLMDAHTAIQCRDPDFVLACWMPAGADWTGAVRAAPRVRAYVLVGEADGGGCGRAWETWGVGEGGEGGSGSDSESGGGGAPPLPPYAADGFARSNLDLGAHACVCRTDERWCSARRSRAVAFERVE